MTASKNPEARLLAQVLGNIYNGPVLAREDGKWVLGFFYDAPVSTEIVVTHADWESFLKLVADWHRDSNGKE